MPGHITADLVETISETLSSVLPQKANVDSLGLRFLTLAKSAGITKMRALKAAQKAAEEAGSLDKVEVELTELPWLAVACGLHSQSQTVLVDCVVALCPGYKWEDLRNFHLAMLVESPATLKGVAEKIAMNAFKAEQDPMACALLYVILGKQRPLAMLFKAKKNMRMFEFFGKDFTTEANIIVAKKNAYACMPKHNFKMAATLFALGGMTKQAIDVIANNLKDLELAALVARSALLTAIQCVRRSRVSFCPVD